MYLLLAFLQSLIEIFKNIVDRLNAYGQADEFRRYTGTALFRFRQLLVGRARRMDDQ